MYKVIGLISVLSSSVMTGLVMAGEMSQRVNFLKEIKQAAIHIKSDFEYRAPVLSECFEQRGEFFSKVEEYITLGGCSPCDAVKKACEGFKRLKIEDRQTLCSFGENLSSEEIQGQIANISWLIEALDEIINRAEEEYRTKGRLYKSGGVLAGLGFVILLL